LGLGIVVGCPLGRSIVGRSAGLAASVLCVHR